MLLQFCMTMISSARSVGFAVLILCLQACQYFMPPDKILESSEADELCYQWKEETRKDVMKFEMDYTLFNRGCKLNTERSLYLGYQGDYLTGNEEQDQQIMSSWKVVKTFQLKR